MRNLDDRLRRDLEQIADRTTPSPTTAWAAIQSRIEDQADELETEITMLQPDTPNARRVDARLLVAAAAVLVVLVGISVALFRTGDSNSLDVTDTDTTVPVTSTTSVPSTTSTPPEEEEPNPDDGAASLVVAEAFIRARNDYDGEAVRALFADDAFVRDDLQRDENGVFRGLDEIDFVRLSELDLATGVTLLAPECTVDDPTEGRVSCTYDWENSWSRALADDRYGDNTFVFDVVGGRIGSMTNVFRQGPVDGFENHISEVMFLWIATNHPDERDIVLAGGLPVASDESIALWQSYTAQFVAEQAAVAFASE